MDPDPTLDAMRTAAQALKCGDVRGKLHAVQAAQDALDAAKSVLLAELSASGDFELDGASTLNTWVRNQLRLNPGPASVLVRNIAALRDLPAVGEAAMAGEISAAHVKVFTYGLQHVGHEPMRQFEEVFLEVARECAPGELFEAVKHLKDVTHPDELDAAWERGMDREDLAVDAVPDGYHVNGFLNTVTGAKLKTILDSISAPRDADDTRTGSQRRVQGLDDLLSSILAGGLPSDKGIRPHLSVFVDANTPAEPATLAGHGAIGPDLLNYLACVSDATSFLTQTGDGTRQAQILNAGRSRYQPTPLQRRSVIARQKGVCATPGCSHTHLEIHHVIWWSNGGATDLDLLVGLCVRCHHLLHRQRLSITGNAVDGFTFTTQTGKPLTRHRRTRYRQAA